MELKVRALDTPEQKSVQEVEQELLEKHEQKYEDVSEEKTESTQTALDLDTPEESVVNDTPEVQEEEVKTEEVEEITPELSEDQVLTYIGERYGKQINSFDELMTERETTDELPEDVAAYFKYKKETGRGIEDYVRLRKDFNSMNPDSLLREYLTVTEGEGLDPEDIDSLMDDYSYDEEIDEESVIKKVKLAKKRTIAKAKKFFNEQKELYKQPLESSSAVDSQANEELIAVSYTHLTLPTIYSV